MESDMTKKSKPINYREPIPHSMLAYCKAPPLQHHRCAFYWHDAIIHSQCGSFACGYCTSSQARLAAEGR